MGMLLRRHRSSIADNSEVTTTSSLNGEVVEPMIEEKVEEKVEKVVEPTVDEKVETTEKKKTTRGRKRKQAE